MAAFDFPSNPSNGDVYNAPNGKQYTYNSANSCWRGGTVLGAQGRQGAAGAQGAQGVQGAAASGTNGIIRQVALQEGPASQTSYNSSNWTTIIAQNITVSNSSHRVLVEVKAGFYGGDEGTVYNAGRILRGTTNIREIGSIWGRVNAGSGFKACYAGPTVNDNPGTGTHTYYWQTKRTSGSGSDLIVHAYGNSLKLTEYEP